MKIIKLSEPLIDNKEINAVSNVLKSGWLTSGKITKIFEEKISNYLNVKNVIAANSCTNGIFVTIKALGLKKGDEILTSPFTFISTINSIHQLGLNIKFVDINLNDFNINVEDLKKKVTKKTKCVLITHFGGVPCDLNRIYKICGKKIHIIEDAATALGAEFNKKRVGSFNNSISIFSLYANKVITTAEGGLISTNNDFFAKKIRTLISLGIDKTPWVRTKKKFSYKFDLKFPGYKFNFTDLQACIGIEQLKKLNSIIKKREKIREKYDELLAPLVQKNLISLLKINENIKSAQYIYTILITNKRFSRDKLIKKLNRKKISTTVHYTPAMNLTYYKKMFNKVKMKNTDFVFKNVISIPFHNNLKQKEIEYISKQIIYFFKNENKKK